MLWNFLLENAIMERINSDGFILLCLNLPRKKKEFLYSGGLEEGGLSVWEGPMAREYGKMVDTSIRGWNELA